MVQETLRQHKFRNMSFKNKQLFKIGDKNYIKTKQQVQLVVRANFSCSGVSTLFLLP